MLVIIFAVFTVCMVRRFIKNRGTSTIVKAVPVTTIANPVASGVATTSASNIEVQMSQAGVDEAQKVEEGDETKI